MAVKVELKALADLLARVATYQSDCSKQMAPEHQESQLQRREV